MSKTATKTKAEAETLFGKLPEQATSKGQVAVADKAKPKKTAVDPPKNEIATIGPVNPRNMLAVILQAASNPKVDVPKMQALLAMQKEMVAEQSRLDFTQAFFELKKELPRIDKDGKIVIVAKEADGRRPTTGGRVQQSTPYATYEHIREVIDPILDRHGFTMWDETEPSPDGTRIHVITHLDHNSGHGRRSIFPLPAEASGSKNNVQGWGASNSYGKRYGTLNLLNIRTKAPEDRDTDGNRPKMTKGGKPQIIEGDVVTDAGVASIILCTDEELIKVRDAIAGCGVSEKGFCNHFGINKVSQLPQARLQDALDACKAHAERDK